MITERLFCVKLCETGFWLHPGAAAHPKVHANGQQNGDCQHHIESGVGSPLFHQPKRLEEVHAKKTRDKCKRHKENSNDGESFHDLVHTVIDHRKIGVENTANQVTKTFIQVMQPDKMIVEITEEYPIFRIHDLEIVAGKFIHHFTLGEYDPSHRQQNAF